MTFYKIKKGMLSPKELPCWCQEKIALYSRAGILVSSKEVWLMYNADAHCTKGRGGSGPNGQRENLMFKFFLVQP